jgi:hypothetical protein
MFAGGIAVAALMKRTELQSRRRAMNVLTVSLGLAWALYSASG